jgi:hypothetical protein
VTRFILKPMGKTLTTLVPDAGGERGLIKFERRTD